MTNKDMPRVASMLRRHYPGVNPGGLTLPQFFSLTDYMLKALNASKGK